MFKVYIFEFRQCNCPHEDLPFRRPPKNPQHQIHTCPCFQVGSCRRRTTTAVLSLRHIHIHVHTPASLHSRPVLLTQAPPEKHTHRMLQVRIPVQPARYKLVEGHACVASSQPRWRTSTTSMSTSPPQYLANSRAFKAVIRFRFCY